MTRAEEYRLEAVRAASARKRARRGRRSEAEMARAAREQRARRARARAEAAGAMPHNQAPTRTKNSSYELEAAARPSRKSTRKALNRQKNDSALRITQVSRQSSAPVRAKAAAPRKNRAR